MPIATKTFFGKKLLAYAAVLAGGVSTIHAITPPAHVKETLEQRCAECHNPKGKARESGILDSSATIESLADEGLVNPRNPDQSEILKRIDPNAPKDEVMPPNGKTLTAEQAEALRKWVLEASKEMAAKKATPTPHDLSKIDYRTTHEAILSDIKSLKKNSQTRTLVSGMRYISLANNPTNLSNDVLKHAVIQTLNSLTFSKEVIKLTPVNESIGLYRINLRELGWSSRAWEILQDNNPQSIAHFFYQNRSVERLEVSYENTFIKNELRTDVPFAQAYWFVRTAFLSDVSAELLGVRSRNLRDLLDRLGVDYNAGANSTYAIRRSGVTGQNRTIIRLPSKDKSIARAVWVTYDYLNDTKMFESEENGGRVFSKSDGGEAFVVLPNGSLYGVLYNGNEAFIRFADPTLAADPLKRELGLSTRSAHDFRKGQSSDIPSEHLKLSIEAGASCTSCHARGLIPFENTFDQVSDLTNKFGVKPPAGFEVVGTKTTLREQMRSDQAPTAFKKYMEANGMDPESLSKVLYNREPHLKEADELLATFGLKREEVTQKFYELIATPKEDSFDKIEQVLKVLQSFVDQAQRSRVPLRDETQIPGFLETYERN